MVVVVGVDGLEGESSIAVLNQLEVTIGSDAVGKCSSSLNILRYRDELSVGSSNSNFNTQVIFNAG
jgi:hypothetical protein